MKKVRIGFAALIALAAMSFTIASHAKVFEKRKNLANCYPTITTANYMTACAATPTFVAITCANKVAAIGQALQNNLNLSSFSSGTVACDGGDFLCCISLKASTTNPCTSDLHNSFKKGGFTDFNGIAIPATSWVLINDIQCKSIQ
jgi:hypothetical protein